MSLNFPSRLLYSQPQTRAGLSTYAIQSGLRSWWPKSTNDIVGTSPFNFNSTYTAVNIDSRGYGVLNGASLGANDYLYTKTPPFINFSGQWSAVTWYKPSGSAAKWIILSYGDGLVFPYYYWQIQQDVTTNILMFMAYDGTNRSISSSVALTIGQYHQIAVTYNAGVATLYINGASVATGSVPTLQRTDESHRLTLGYNAVGAGSTYPFYGQQQNTSLFSSCLTPAQVKTLFDHPWSLGVYPNRQRYFGIAGGGGDITLALSGQAATSTAGSLLPQFAVPMTGQGATVAAGTTSPSLSGVLAGAAISSTAGSLLPQFSIPMTGQRATLTAGSTTPGYSFGLTGQGMTSATGSLLPVFGIPLTGQQITVTPGTMTPFAGVVLALTGQGMTSSTGTLGVQFEVPLTGQGMTILPGTMTPSGAPVTTPVTQYSWKVKAIGVKTKIGTKSDVNSDTGDQ